MSVNEKQNVKEFQLLDKPINHSINKRYTKPNNLHTKKLKHTVNALERVLTYQYLTLINVQHRVQLLKLC